MIIYPTELTQVVPRASRPFLCTPSESDTLLSGLVLGDPSDPHLPKFEVYNHLFIIIVLK